MKSLVVVFTLLFLVQQGAALLWEDEDTIGIEAGKTSKRRSVFEDDDFSDIASIPDFDLSYANNGEYCRNRKGEMGVCAPLSECYPVLYTLDAYRGQRNISNWPLAEEILKSVGPCNNNYQDIRNNVVCCSTLMQSRFSERRPTRPPQKAPLPVTAPSCGNQRVVDGSEPRQGSYPWIAALMLRGRQFCGGTLIDNYHVMTAAHCIAHFNGNDVENLRIYLGAHDLYSALEKDRIVSAVSRVVYHRGFSHQTLLYDIALIRLARPVNYQQLPNVQAICLTTGNPRYDVGYPWAKLAGWGKLYHTGPQPSRLQHIDVQVFPNDECGRRYGRIPPAGYLPDHNVCAKGRGRGDACQGDSGGPLMRFLGGTRGQPRRVEQIGVVSWGVNCGQFPGVYTRVDHFQSWLNKNRYG